jgi:hypothetical protein
MRRVKQALGFDNLGGAGLSPPLGIFNCSGWLRQSQNSPITSSVLCRRRLQVRVLESEP